MNFSTHSEQAVQRALDLAQRFAGDVTLVHAVDSNSLYDEFYDPIIPLKPDIDLELADAAAVRMQKLTGMLGAGRLQSEVHFGSPRSIILSQAEAMRADLIVIGRHGHRGFGRLLGSTASAVSNSARCDVLTVYIDKEAGEHR